TGCPPRRACRRSPEADYPESQAYKLLTLRKDAWNINPGGSLEGALPGDELHGQLPPLIDAHVELVDHPPLRVDKARRGFRDEEARNRRILRLVGRGPAGPGRHVELHGYRRRGDRVRTDHISEPCVRHHRVGVV